ncbi:MAG: pyrroline-5-carboxylate reductase [Steroidobacteraceae bacterium]|nr:pyrroline-5-carboxylate reductase [Steroidobacteraceae bacterium]MCC7200697.1 pyrroline-5-carboxylate reductase [Gammaproteobacteria bacterium]
MDIDTLAFIGGGHMARALIGGLLARGWAATSIRVSDPSAAQRESLAAAFPGIACFADNEAAAAGAGTWVLAVKPQHMREAATGLAQAVRAPAPLVVSVAAGIRVADLARWLGPGVAIVRCMPNRPALLGCGCTGLYADAAVRNGHRARAERVLAAVGSCVWVEEESQIDAVTAVSGSGPAYFFLLMELLEEAALAEGLPAATARALAIETAYGAARMAREADDTPAILREQVTSRGGTTEAALAVFRDAGLRDIVLRAVGAARRRSAELARQFGD